VTGDAVQPPHKSRILKGSDWLQHRVSKVLDIDIGALPHTLDQLENGVR